MKKRYGLSLLAGMMSVILAAGSISLPVQAGIFDKVRQSVDEAAENTRDDIPEDVYELDFVANEFSDYVTADNGNQAEWTYTRLFVNDDKHERLNAVLKKHTDLNMELVQDSALEIAETFDGVMDEHIRLYYSILSDSMRTDSLVLSFWEEEYYFDGYEYNNGYSGYNFNPASGKKIKARRYRTGPH
ncbi:MAG: hypothetical protein IJV14_05965 [Lachnospiraceae bacterium]|nr:hypothetical protein [Lachnospiraceae bacterium]